MRIVVLHAGGLGDLVLVESYLAALREQYPRARIEVVCRLDVAPVARLYARPVDAVHPFAFNPYRWALPDDEAALQARALLPKLAGAPIDFFVSAELRATWLSEILAAALTPQDALISDDRRFRSGDLQVLLGKMGLERNRDVRRLPALEGEHELDRYGRLAGNDARRRPALRELDVVAARELVVFPLAASRINRWPLEAMGESARRIAAAQGATLALIGGEHERDELEAAARAGVFGADPAIVIGASDDLTAVATRIAGAAGYLGIETGLVHLAAAYGVPGATVYGGGYWPVYGPWAPRTIGVAAPIPCFGCEWDCAFDRPFCLEGVDAPSVVAAFDAALADESGLPLVRTLDAYGPRERAIFGAAAGVYRTAQADRSARLGAITRLRTLLARYAHRTRTRSRRTNTLLAALAETTAGAARQIEEGSGVRPPIAASRAPSRAENA